MLRRQRLGCNPYTHCQTRGTPRQANCTLYVVCVDLFCGDQNYRYCHGIYHCGTFHHFLLLLLLLQQTPATLSSALLFFLIFSTRLPFPPPVRSSASAIL